MSLCYRKGNILFFLIRKNMSQTMDTILKLSQFHSLNHLPSNLNDFYKIAILRNPLDRFISAYVMIIEDKRHNKDSPFKNAQLTKETLRTFIGMLEKRFFDGHLRPQMDSLPIRMDKYLIQERIDKDLKQLSFSLELPKEYLKSNKLIKINSQSVKDKKFVKNQLNKTLINKLKRIYKEDFKLYGQLTK